ncbi:MAG TPA: hypothetical protein VMV69_13355 [Pirellulales bacterium]|nr:hypothetical protein [Pirellulales bacterium]
MTRRRAKPNPNSRSAGKTAAAEIPRPREERWDWLWLAAFLPLVFLVSCVEIEDGDIWWHLRTGQLIVERCEIPRTDWFTYTNPDRPWIDLHWGFQLIVAGLWTLGGAPALVLAKCCLGTATFALCLSCRRPQWPWRRVVACWLPSLLIFSGRNQVRPEMFSLLFLAGTLAVLFHQRRRPWLVWWLPVIQILWINIHALFILGLVVWACFLADAVVRGFVARRFIAGNGPLETCPAEPPTTVELRRWAVVTLLMVAAALVNPYGREGATFPLTLFERIQGDQRGFYQGFAGEFHGLGDFIGKHGLWAALNNLTTGLLLALFGLGLATFGWLLAIRRFCPFRALLFALFAYLAWQASRNSALFALVGGVVLEANVGELSESRPAAPTRRFHLGRVVLASLLGLLLVALPSDVFWTVAHGEMPRRFGWGEVPRAFAHESARFLGREGMPKRVFAVDQGAAAVYIFHNGPKRRVFADGRLEVHSRRTLERYQAIWHELTTHDPAVIDHLLLDVEPEPGGAREVPALLIDVAAVSHGWPTSLALFADARFRAVHFDESAFVFLTTEQADRLGLDAVPLTQRAVLLQRLRQANRRIEPKP